MVVKFMHFSKMSKRTCISKAKRTLLVDFFTEREISSLYNARFLRDGEAFESV